MDLFFKPWWDSGNEDPEEFADLVQQYADIIRRLEREACIAIIEQFDSCDPKYIVKVIRDNNAVN